uniref:Uncharacterized protein n=1 Tax=Anopheles atroparvus TaxID=41427 RepID=A0A182JKE2_ANOAO
MFGRTVKASIAKDNGKSADNAQRKHYPDKSRCYECGTEGHLSYNCPKNVLGSKTPPRKAGAERTKRKQRAAESESFGCASELEETHLSSTDDGQSVVKRYPSFVFCITYIPPHITSVPGLRFDIPVPVLRTALNVPLLDILRVAALVSLRLSHASAGATTTTCSAAATGLHAALIAAAAIQPSVAHTHTAPASHAHTSATTTAAATSSTGSTAHGSIAGGTVMAQRAVDGQRAATVRVVRPVVVWRGRRLMVRLCLMVPLLRLLLVVVVRVVRARVAVRAAE